MLFSLLFTCVYIVCKMANIARYQASTAVYFRSSLFRDVWRLRLVVVYRRFGTQYWVLPLGARRRDHYIFRISLLPITKLCRVSSENSAGLMLDTVYTALLQTCLRIFFFRICRPHFILKVEVQTCWMFTTLRMCL
jgi:hypothetical protein